MSQAKVLKPYNRRKGYIRKRLRESWQWYVLLLPGLIICLFLSMFLFMECR